MYSERSRTTADCSRRSENSGSKNFGAVGALGAGVGLMRVLAFVKCSEEFSGLEARFALIKRYFGGSVGAMGAHCRSDSY
jgi:hypothetical protein